MDQQSSTNHNFITWQDEICHVFWLPLHLCVCARACVRARVRARARACVRACVRAVSVYLCIIKNVSEFVRSLASRVLEIS